MPGSKTFVTGIKEARRKLKDIGDNALRERTIVSAAKKNSKQVLRDMKGNLQPIAPELTRVLGQKKIPRKFGGAEWPGAWTGVKNKSDFTIQTTDGTPLSIYWVEYGTEERTQKTTGRGTGKFPEYAPTRNAINSNSMSVRRGFHSELIAEINRRIKRNKI